MKHTLYSILLWPIWYAYLIIILPIFLIFIIFVRKEYFHYFLRPMSYFFCLFGGQRLRVYGEIPDPESGPFLYLMNHESLFDHFAIGRYIKHYVTAIAKYEQFKYPLWGHVAKYYGIEPIDRSNTKKAIKSLKKVEMEIAINQFLDKWETAVRLRSRPYENPNHKPNLLKKVYNAERIIN